MRIGARLSLDLSAFYRRNGQAEYLANGVEEDPIRTQANMMAFRIGLIFTDVRKLPESR